MLDTIIRMSGLEVRKGRDVAKSCGQTNPEMCSATMPSPEIVMVVAVNMHDLFRQTVHMFVSADLAVDWFHVITRVDRALDVVHTRPQSKEMNESRRVAAATRARGWA